MRDTYFALWWYNSCISDYNKEEYIIASGCLIGMEHIRQDLPDSLQDQYDEYAKAADRELITQYFADMERRRREEEKKNHSSSSYSSGCDDEYNACEYDDPYDFWYWNEDFFIDYEDAEEYWEEYH